MRAWGLAVLVLSLCAACYHGTDGLSCKIRCDEGCPSGMTCQGGLCTSGASCTADDGGSTCGAIGQACCASAPACSGNGACVGGTCSECVTAVALGRHHVCVVEHDGTVWCAGEGGRGQLGNNTFNNSATPVQVQDAQGPITNAVSVTAGRQHTCATRSDGSLWCWGANGYGEIGDNSYNDRSVAVQVIVSGGQPLANVAEASAGFQHTCARDTSGSLWCWGYDNDGELGDNSTSTRPYGDHVTVNGTAFTGAKSLSVGHYHSCAIDGTDKAWCWGYNSAGQVGDNSNNTAYQPQMITDATAVAVGSFHTCALRADSSVACWGEGIHDRLGSGSENSSSTPTPVLVAANGAPLVGATMVATGGMSCALMSDHRVLCWGTNPHGQIGNGAGASVPAAVLLGDGELGDVDRIYANWAHVCAHRSDGSLVCWGRDLAGEFADGAGQNHAAPVPLGFTCNR